MIALAALAARALSNARSDAGAVRSWWADLAPSTRKVIVGLMLAVAGYFIHQHYAGKAISTAVEKAKAEQLEADQAAMDKHLADDREAREQARKDDARNKARVEGEARAVNERTVDEYEDRLADADARYRRLRAQAASAPVGPGGGGAAPVPGAGSDRPAAAGPAGQDGFSLDDRYLATKQAIQLDQLIKAVKGIQAIDPNGEAPKEPKP